MRYHFWNALLLSSLTHGRHFSNGKDVKGNSYDYVVVGGGITGLVVANRLSEDPRKTVLIVERGDFADGPRAIYPYWARFLDTDVMIRPVSAPVAGLNNGTFNVPVAAVVGGGSVVNGMAYMRGSKADYDAWEELGNPGWGWDGLLPYFRKSTTFMPPSPEAAAAWNITWEPSVYGEGPARVTIPDYQYADLPVFRDAWSKEPGVTVKRELNAGGGPGLHWAPSTIDRRDQTRATARKEYYDPINATRPNLHLLTGHVVEEILFQRSKASGIRALSRQDNSTYEVYAKKEVILAAGAVQTPQLLQVSGVGPKDVLEGAGITVKKDMPAVGANFQDHATILASFNLSHQSFPDPNSVVANATFNASAWEEYFEHRTGPVTTGSSNGAISFSLSQLVPSARSVAEKLLSQRAEQYLPSVYGYRPLLRGFEAQRKILAKGFISNSSSISSGAVVGNGFAATPFLKPASRGTVTLDPTNPRGLPIVQYNTLMNPVDSDIILAMLKRTRAYWKSPELARFEPVEATPGAQYQTDEEIMSALRRGFIMPGLAHPSCTCAMLPEALGGCVGSDLTVYGIENLSIIDASILPLIPGAPLQATMYAVAEKAADLIKARA
ncbi:alcohol oxidase [Byssothecium circinans]|uniref:Alcohol oxidase n=1 Tax=Byssothecium circinans TaxID=147558 RepID=A0A6A5TRW4_9PLEO|nr:alcohol oxidase [Byssothecium circinans]